MGKPKKLDNRSEFIATKRTHSQVENAAERSEGSVDVDVLLKKRKTSNEYGRYLVKTLTTASNLSSGYSYNYEDNHEQEIIAPRILEEVFRAHQIKQQSLLAIRSKEFYVENGADRGDNGRQSSDHEYEDEAKTDRSPSFKARSTAPLMEKNEARGGPRDGCLRTRLDAIGNGSEDDLGPEPEPRQQSVRPSSRNAYKEDRIRYGTSRRKP